jgi:hypothetical protein
MRLTKLGNGQMLVVWLLGVVAGMGLFLVAEQRAQLAHGQDAAGTITSSEDSTTAACCRTSAPTRAGTGTGVLLARADSSDPEQATAGKKPSIVFIMGDDVGWFNIGAYHQGIMAGRTPNLDRMAAEGMRFTDYYAEASCTAGRANFITGQLPIRTGLTTVGQAGATVGMPAQVPTIATVLKSMGYATGQLGKNHLGDRNEYLPTVHGFDEFFGYLYHLDAMEDPAHPNYPQDLKDKIGPRNMIHLQTILVTIAGVAIWMAIARADLRNYII